MAKQRSAPPAAVAQTEPAPTAEGYTVLARRYRPQQFQDVVGQEAVVQALMNAVQGNRVAHAYLFTGARGVGKTSTARILAKALNCVKGPTATPCGECDSCKAIASGEDVDVVEIDGASNRQIDDVRGIRQNVHYRPSRARFKIYIIDEVHMLTKEAFNALLKTLEEPPPHVKFIFATTDVQKVPVTILSRCQRFDFAGISTQRIVERLREVVKAEGVQADDEALELIARRASGSLRDAQSLLDQLLAFGGTLTAEQVHRLLGTASDDRVLALASAVLERDAKRALELLGEGINEGLNLGEVLDQLTEYWRDLMVVHCAGVAKQDLSVPPRHRDQLAHQAKSLELDTILAGLDILSSTRARLRGSSHGRVLVEMALVRLARLESLVPLSQVAQWLTQPRGAEDRKSPPRPPASAGSTTRLSEPPEAAKKKADSAAEPAPVQDPVSLTAESLPRLWPEILAQIGPMHKASVEKAGLPAIIGPNTLVLSFAAEYNHQREYCQESSRVARIEEAMHKLTGRAWGLRIESASDGPRDSLPTPENTDTPVPRTRKQRAEVEQEPLIKRAADVLEARFVHLDEGFGATPAVSVERTDLGDGEEN
jgi:DNA polymerase-3 subunit gamma/tau